MEQPSNMKFMFWAALSICSSVGIILVNKSIMRTFEFNYVFSLTSMHFICQAVVLEILGRIGVFPIKSLPFAQNWMTACCGVGSIVFMNFNLRFNSVGFYQMTKLLCIPLIVAIQSTFYGKSFSRKIKATLFLIISGVGIAAVTDLSVNSVGLFFGGLAVISTTQYQIWQGSKREQFQLQAIQITHSVSLPLAIICSSCAYFFEALNENDSVFDHEFAGPEEYFLIGISCMFAISVNVCSFTLIGMSSPVTYQVIGHCKTVLVLLGGMLLFSFSGSTVRFMNNILGICVAMLGVVLYGSVKNSQNKDSDLFDRFVPFPIRRMIGVDTNTILGETTTQNSK